MLEYVFVTARRLKPLIQRVRKLLSSPLIDSRHAIRGLDQFRIGILHQVADGEDHLVQERLLWPEQASVTNGAANNLRST